VDDTPELVEVGRAPEVGDEIEARAAHARVVELGDVAVGERVESSIIATPAYRPAPRSSASTIAMLSVPWQLACTNTARDRPSRN
jgi:hypothetical protein